MTSKAGGPGPPAGGMQVVPRRRRLLHTTVHTSRYVVVACYAACIGYLCLIALRPALPEHVWSGLRWFGAPGSVLTVLTVLAFPLALFMLSRLTGHRTFGGTPILMLAGMAASAVALGMSAYWRCHDEQSPFFAPLSWTLGLFVGNVEGRYGSERGVCGTDAMPLALELARLLAISTTLTTALAAALTLCRSQLDRIAIWRARSVTVVVGMDDETISMLRAIAASLDDDETLVVITASADRTCVAEVRALGARVREVSLGDPSPLSSLRLWKKLDRLYLLSEDPAQNEARLAAISSAMDYLGDDRLRLPLTVRIDDPWQAEVWRRSFLDEDEMAASQSRHRRWVADAVGRYEITATKVVRHLTATAAKGHALIPPDTVVLCGLYPMTYALSSELAQAHREQEVYASGDHRPPSRVAILARGAPGFVEDHYLRQSRIAPGQTGIAVDAYDVEPTVEVISEHLAGLDSQRCAVVLSDPSIEIHGTRLAARFPRLRIYQASAAAVTLPETSIVGQLYRFPISMELDPDAPQDVWEHAAELIHERYSAGEDRSQWTARPWKLLDPFVKQSNRRQVINTLWLVEAVGHTWNTLEYPPASPLAADFAEMSPLQQLQELGFDSDTAELLLRREHEDWCRFYFDAGWKHAEQRCDAERRHDRLLPWEELMEQDAELRKQGVTDPDPRLNLTRAQRSLVGTLVSLRNLGYRSIPKPDPRPVVDSAGEPQWRRYRRRGVVSAQRRDRDWTWTTGSGDTMHGKAGDWAVTDERGRERSVATGIFEGSHEFVEGHRYRRTGTVEARRVTADEVVATKEGDALARPGDWIVRGHHGEQWPVPAKQFLETYEGPLDMDGTRGG
ncbi:RyR domain-containing protein [Mycobacterium sp. 1274761.0]|uniref:RyR domain-containing protein n=1 Tax=Mycobacterium sp. 1274761.0 TaxID=1834077 RepID=UPI0008007F33|nr:RyR domain-containing protein [Mycobacterium sp. 1274761.0]OBK71300.1 hypothetical protein A5651_19015 [Mycobacterium sp. 1274761.0]